MAVSYRELLLNPPMACLLAARTLDPIATTSIYSYMFAQLKWLSPDASDVQIATQAGLLTAAKTTTKVLTNLWWGRLSDKSYGGRRMVLLISLLASCIATVGYGFATSFAMAIFWQAFNGAMSSSIGIIRCIVSETETRPSHRSRALLLLPLAGSVGQFVGPVLGGLLTTIVKDGDTSLFGRFPFALPNIVLASFYAVAFFGALLAVDESLETFDKSKGSGFWQCWLEIWSGISGKKSDGHSYAVLPTEESDSLEGPPRTSTTPTSATFQIAEESHQQIVKELTFWQIWTPQVICTLIAHFIIAGHIMTFQATWSIFLASPVSDGVSESPFLFTGGLGLNPAQIGTLASVFALVGILLQTSLPSLNDRFGVVSVWRSALFFYPFAYLLAPFSAVVAASVGHVATWFALAVVYTLFVVARIGSQPAMTLLIDNAVPAPSARGTINVAGTVVGNLSRSIIPITLMALYGWGYEHDVVWVGFWAMAILSVCSIFASRWVKMKTDRIDPQTMPAGNGESGEDDIREPQTRSGEHESPRSVR